MCDIFRYEDCTGAWEFNGRLAIKIIETGRLGEVGPRGGGGGGGVRYEEALGKSPLPCGSGEKGVATGGGKW